MGRRREGGGRQWRRQEERKGEGRRGEERGRKGSREGGEIRRESELGEVHMYVYTYVLKRKVEWEGD